MPSARKKVNEKISRGNREVRLRHFSDRHIPRTGLFVPQAAIDHTLSKAEAPVCLLLNGGVTGHKFRW